MLGVYMPSESTWLVRTVCPECMEHAESQCFSRVGRSEDVEDTCHYCGGVAISSPKQKEDHTAPRQGGDHANP